jgi:hypothetical protein
MQRDQPDVIEILRTVKEFVDEITEQLGGQERYHAMCASYLLAIAERELILGPTLDANEHNAAGAFPDDVAELSARIRSGEFDSQWDGVFAFVLDHVIHKVRISKPEHLHPLHQTA